VLISSINQAAVLGYVSVTMCLGRWVPSNYPRMFGDFSVRFLVGMDKMGEFVMVGLNVETCAS
jgi:hypothetical protein